MYSIELIGAFLLLAHIVIGFVATILISTSRTPSAAIAWVLAQGEHVVAIPGSDRLAYLEENVGADGLRLDDTDLAALDAVPPAHGTRY